MEVEPAPGGPEPDLPPGRAPRWGLGEAAAGLIGGFFLSSILASIWLAATGQKELSLGGQGFSQVGLWLGLLGAPIYAARRKGSGRMAVDFGLVFRPVDAAIGLVVGLGAQFLVVPLISVLLRPLLGEPDVSRLARELAEKASGAGVVGVIVAVAVITAIAEELFFRGLLLRALQCRVGDGWAVAVSSLVFGLVHLQTNLRSYVLVMASLSVFGVLLALLTLRTRRLGPAILAHAVFNGWTLLVVLVINP